MTTSVASLQTGTVRVLGQDELAEIDGQLISQPNLPGLWPKGGVPQIKRDRHRLPWLGNGEGEDQVIPGAADLRGLGDDLLNTHVLEVGPRHPELDLIPGNGLASDLDLK